MTTLTVSYTTIDKMLDAVPMVGSVSTLSSAQLFAFAGRAEALINATVVNRYSLPLVGEFPLLETVATDLALYYVLSRRIFTQERMNESGWVDRFKESLDILMKLKEGKLPLVNTSGDLVSVREDLRPVFSTTQNYEPTMHEGPLGTQVVDIDKVDDLLDERSQSVFFDLVR